MKRALFFAVSLLYMWPVQSYAQQEGKDWCGYHYVINAMEARDPQFAQKLKAQLQKQAQLLAASRLSQINSLDVTVPVVFHIVLDSAQYQQIGDSAGIAARAASQIEVLNQDYNRENADSTNIPAAFKPLYGDVHIKFGLAHTDPHGQATNGWDVTITNRTSFDASTDDPASDAKHTSAGGADAWDVARYVNVWVVNFTNGSQSSILLGLTVPPAFTNDTVTGFPKSEMGILLNYGAFGKRTSLIQYFINGIDLGRTLTHEMGHYFGLFHPWGDDGGLCPGDIGGKDDGIADTPPEANATYGCPIFPHFDHCSPSGNGIMFMNYMDYTDDDCMNMFTADQIAVMQSKIAPGGESHQLTIHPELLNYPGSTPAFDNSFVISPNPSVNGNVYITFNQLPQGFQTVVIRNIAGQKVAAFDTEGQQTTYFPLNLSGLSTGMYFITCYFTGKTDTRKIIIR